MKIMLRQVGKHMPKEFVEVDAKVAPFLVAGGDYKYKDDRTTDIRSNASTETFEKQPSKKTGKTK